MRSELGIGAVPWRYLAANFLVSLLPTCAMYRTRLLLYRLAGFEIGKCAVIHGRLTMIGHGNIYRRLHVGEGCRINSPCFIGLMGEVTLEERAVIGYGVTITTAVHDTSDPDCRAGQVYGKPVRIGAGAWIAANVTILPGVTIGPGAIIGAGSVVTRDVPAHTFAAGVPARPIRLLDATRSSIGYDTCVGSESLPTGPTAIRHSGTRTGAGLTSPPNSSSSPIALNSNSGVAARCHTGVPPEQAARL
jgi:maltose O-acetyltransferase